MAVQDTDIEQLVLKESILSATGIDEYYLRNVTICTVQDFVRTQFNCDGTQLFNSKNDKTFIEKNIPWPG
ncbi:MAG: hypothetical protein QNL62_21410 [Gammaproteobacteria bacterium]|nr:hypothetical protein [Gammaproteobacteria bacterium]